jgi:hypothetical protein
MRPLHPDVITRAWAERLGLDFETYKRAPAFVHHSIEWAIKTATGRKPANRTEMKK